MRSTLINDKKMINPILIIINISFIMRGVKRRIWKRKWMIPTEENLQQYVKEKYRLVGVER